jgi:peptidyl-prolyl cis-trans isomerase D
MAVIGKIRQRSGLLIIIIGGALAAFILTDLFSGRMGTRDQVIGEVGGQEISMRAFELRVENELESYRTDFGQNVTNQMTDQVRATVWNEMVKELAMLDKVRAAGFNITKAEYDDLRFGDNILPEYRNQEQFMRDGQPDRAALQEYFNTVQLKAPRWNDILKRRIVENRLYAKYTTLVKKSIHVNSAQARAEYEDKNHRATFEFVAKRYDSEPDSLYVVSDRDLRRYFDKHRNNPKYRQKPGRRFEYVLFQVTPTEDDALALRRELEGLKEPFATAENDSLFVIAQAESRFFSRTPYRPGSLDMLTDSLVQNAEVGEVVGPFRDGQQWKLMKVVELADVPEARVRHILLSTQQGKTEEEQKKRADSLLTVVKRDRKKFEEMVTKFSDDPGSVSNGGVYEWFDKFQMVPEFTAASFDEKVGAITIAKTTYGFHIVEVLGQRTRKERRVATVERTIKPSPATFKQVYKKANDFSLRYKKDVATFRAGAEENGLTVTPVDDLRPEMRSVPGLAQAANTISWVNRNKVGMVSAPLDAGDSYAVAIITGIREEGPPELEDVRELFTKEVVKEKKAEDFIGRMRNKTDLAVLAGDLGLSVQTANDMAFSTYSIPGGYAEYEVIGQVFALGNGDVSVPLRGETAVFVVKMNTITPAPEVTDVEADRDILVQRLRSRVDNALFNSIREQVGVKDFRYRFY